MLSFWLFSFHLLWLFLCSDLLSGKCYNSIGKFTFILVFTIFCSVEIKKIREYCLKRNCFWEIGSFWPFVKHKVGLDPWSLLCVFPCKIWRFNRDRKEKLLGHDSWIPIQLLCSHLTFPWIIGDLTPKSFSSLCSLYYFFMHRLIRCTKGILELLGPFDIWHVIQEVTLELLLPFHTHSIMKFTVV